MTTLKQNRGRLSRRQVEDRLSRSAGAISARIEAIETELPVKPQALRRIAEQKKTVKVSLAVVAGLGTVLFLRRVLRPGRSTYQEGVDRVSSVISRSIVKNLKKGMTSEEAVRSAMHKRPPVVQMGADGSHGFWATLVNQSVRQVISSLAPELIDALRDRIWPRKQNGHDAGPAKN
jgi:hypothetical protein